MGGTCAEPDTSFVGDGYTTYAKFGKPWAVVHADLPCTNKGATQYNAPPLSRNGVANTAACQAICAASSACDFFSYSFSANKKCATYQGTCAEPDTSFVGDGYTTYAKFGKPWAVVHADLPCTNKGATQYNAPPLSRNGVANTAACQAICAA